MANGKKTNTSPRIRYLVQLAVLVALLLLLEFTGIGMIKTPFLEFTIMQIPVVIGAIVLGPAAGAALGGVFGLLSFWECFGKSAFGVTLMGISPLGTFLTCVPTRILMGLFCGLIFKGLRKVDRTRPQLIAFGGSSLAGSLLNTALFTGVLTAVFYHTDYIQGIAQGFADGTGLEMNPFLFVVLFVGVQGVLEALISAVAGTAISRALYRALNH
ncbi:ECF transporter S component [uncultured Pseudoflavonifractor sp.]|uniref:ECF transporter S component n=1 Tax=uncultured Pseudoflavonifractor sp. TaxID=1221379 RepID=UPI0025FDFA2F|nr:ECF transporter S component [uncultured Pseudoflavonifractor sp.]